MVVVHSSFGNVTTENKEKDSATIEIVTVQTVQTILNMVCTYNKLQIKAYGLGSRIRDYFW